MIATNYAPDQGHLVWIEFDPHVGHEQGGRRPAIVLSSRTYNESSQLAFVCPITNRAKGYPFEVPLTGETTIKGVILVDQMKSFDWAARNISFVEPAPADVVQRVMRKLERLLPGICGRTK